VSDSHRPRISVVNDNPDFLEVMSAILEDDAGYDVSLHDGQTTSIAQLRETKPDLVIIDLLLGGASGWELVALARADEELATVPIIVCSGDVAQLNERADELARVGDVHILRKPFGVDEVTALVASLTGRSSPASTSPG
jgi:CheY-like chemotaxis protein